MLHLSLPPAPAEPRLYLASLEIQTDAQTAEANRFDIRFIDGDPESAAKAVGRWWQNRQVAFPEHFHRLLAIKLWTSEPQRISEDGVLPSERGMVVWEWKIDGGRPLPWEEAHA